MEEEWHFSAFTKDDSTSRAHEPPGPGAFASDGPTQLRTNICSALETTFCLVEACRCVNPSNSTSDALEIKFPNPIVSSCKQARGNVGHQEFSANCCSFLIWVRVDGGTAAYPGGHRERGGNKEFPVQKGAEGRPFDVTAAMFLPENKQPQLFQTLRSPVTRWEC